MATLKHRKNGAWYKVLGALGVETFNGRAGNVQPQAGDYPPELIGAARIATGSYTGNGKYGSGNPCRLTFDFKPKFVSIYGGAVGSLSAVSAQLVYGSPAAVVHPLQTTYPAQLSVTWGENFVEWYAARSYDPTAGMSTTVDAADQLNAAMTYYYIAVG